MNLKEIRKKYPQYGDMTDDELARGLHQRHYSDMDFGDFSQRIGYTMGMAQNTPVEDESQKRARMTPSDTQRIEEPIPNTQIEPTSETPTPGIPVQPGPATIPGITPRDSGITPPYSASPQVNAGTIPGINPQGIPQNLAQLPPPSGTIGDIFGTPDQWAEDYKQRGQLIVRSANEALAGFMGRLDQMATKVSELTGLDKGGLFARARDAYQQNAEQWNQKIGSNPALTDEIIGEIIGGAIPVMFEFAMGTPYAAATGYAEGGTGEALKQAGERALMGQLLHGINKLKLIPRTVLGAALGGGEMAVQGGGPREIAKGAAALGAFSATAVGGRKMGIKEALRPRDPNRGRFVDRKEALRIAEKADQASGASVEPGKLAQEDLNRKQLNDAFDAAHEAGRAGLPMPNPDELAGRKLTRLEHTEATNSYEAGKAIQEAINAGRIREGEGQPIREIPQRGVEPGGGTQEGQTDRGDQVLQTPSRRGEQGRINNDAKKLMRHILDITENKPDYDSDQLKVDVWQYSNDAIDLASDTTMQHALDIGNSNPDIARKLTNLSREMKRWANTPESDRNAIRNILKNEGQRPNQEAYEPSQVQPRPQPAVPSRQGPQEIAKERRHSAIIKKMEEAFNAPVRVGKFRRMGGRRLGIYKTREKVIRVGSANDIETIFHENGHHIQDILGWPEKHKFPEEVRQMAYAGADNLDREGFAEFVRTYVTDEAEARRQAPTFYNEFEEKLAARPDFQNVIIEARQAYNDFKAAPSVSKVGSFIVRGDEQKKRHFPTMDQIYTEVKDSLHPVKKVVQIARAQGGKIAFKDDPYMVARLLRGWARKAEQFIQHRTFQYDSSAKNGVRFTGKGLADILTPIERKGRMKQLDIYLVAKRALSDPRILKGFDRILSVDDFKQTVKELEPEFKDVAEKLYKYNDELLDYLVQSGRISQQTAEGIRAKNLFYTPLHRLIEQETSGTQHLGRAARNVFNPIKRLKGSSRDIISPTENILRNTYAMINAAERNRLGIALMKLSKIKGMGKFIEKVPFPQRPIKIQKDDFLRLMNEYGEPERVTQIQESEREFTRTLGTFSKRPSGKMEPVVKEALTARGWTVAEAQQIIERVKRADNAKERQGIVEKTIEKTTLMIIKEELGFTGMPDEVIATFRPQYRAGANEAIFYDRGKPQLYEMEPEFLKAISSASGSEVNMLIKFMSYPAKWLRAGATTFSPEFGIRNPMRDQMTSWIQSKYGFTPGVDFLRGAYHMLKADDLWQTFNTSGAAHAAIVSTDRDYLSKNLRRLMREKKFKGLILNPLELVQKFSEITEEATRVGEFAKALKKENGGLEGLSRAGMAGREVSLDFSRTGGAAARAANMISAFWNARLEGLDKMARTFKEQPIKAASKAFMGITLPSVLLWYAQKDDPVYQELPTWRKTLFWNFVVHHDGKKPVVLSLPKPFEYGLIFGSIPEAALDWAYRKDPTLFKQTAKQAAKTFDLLPIPTGGIPIGEWWANKSWFFNRPVVPRDKEDLEPVMQYGPHTSETVKLVAQAMDKVPGLRELASPAKIENLIQGYTASAGRSALQGTDWLLEKVGFIDPNPEPPMDLADIPGIRAVISRFPSANSQSIERFYDKYTDLKRSFESDKERAGIRGMGIEGTGFGKSYPREEATAQALSMLRKMARKTYEAKGIDSETKGKLLDSYYIMMTNAARSYFGQELIKK